MAKPPPIPNDSITAPKSGIFGGMPAQQFSGSPWASPLRLASTTAPSSPFSGTAGEKSMIGSPSSIFAGISTKNILGGFGASTSAVNNLPSTTSNMFSNEIDTSKTIISGVQQASQSPLPNNGTAVGFFTPYTERTDSETVFEEYQTIVFLDSYKDYSVEELRMVDYQQGRRGWGDFRPVNTTTPCKVEGTYTSPVRPNKNTPTLILSPKSIRISTKHAMQLGCGVITIHVGDGEGMQSFTIHEALICKRSKFFRDALSGTSKEAQEKTVNLPDDDPTSFALYEQLIYSGWLPSESDTSAFDDIVKEYATLCSLYVLSSKLQDVDAKHVAIDALLGMSRTKMLTGQRTCPLLQHVEIIYHGTHRPCGARRLMVDIYTYRASVDWLEKTFPPDFVFDLAKNNLGQRRTTIDATLTCEASDYYDTDEVAEEEL